MKHRVCVIGAGSSGIVTCKVLKDHGIAFDCYEKGSKVGGLWRYDNDSGLGSIYRSLHINTSKQMMAYSDFPMPDHYPDFPHHSLMAEYFDAYADHFNLRSHIRFQTGVAQVEQLNDGHYSVTTEDGNTEIYTAVCVANGHHWDPRYPNPALPGEFGGKMLHSHDYRTPDIFCGKKNVLVVGIGNSACDIACEAARNTDGKVWISTRSGAYIMPKYLQGRPLDQYSKPLKKYLPRIPQLLLHRYRMRRAIRATVGDQESYGIPKPKRPLLTEHPTISSDLLWLAGHGKIKIKPNVTRLCGDSIEFADGTAEPVDILVYATGYKISFPFFSQELVQVDDAAGIQLYHRVIHPDRKNLFFIGLIQPVGSVMPIAELQAQWVSKLLNGSAALPDAATMKEVIEKKRAFIGAFFNPSPRHALEESFYGYIGTVKNEMRKMATRRQVQPASNPVLVSS